MDVLLSVRLPHDRDSVPFARGLLRQALEHRGVAADVVDDLLLALTETCANVVQHVAVDDDYEVQVELAGAVCRVSVLDDGPGIGTLTPPPAQPSVLDGGHGLGLVRDRVDAVRSERSPDGRHRVVLEKALHHPAVPL